ncbi:hypothetical protein JTB14_016017 [Gonioctena quinquepunctata]|nr:hypothetical protein JTB14_016017 [Gonioctena quinquepunctata]
MTTVSVLSQFRLCPLYVGPNSYSHYICPAYQRCCTEGCCEVITYKYLKYFQSWYFWALVFLFLVILYSCAWYCKKIKLIHGVHNIQGVNRTPMSSCPNASSRTSPGRHGAHVDNFFNYFVETYNKRHPPGRSQNSDSPPKYSDAISMPRLNTSTQVACKSIDASHLECSQQKFSSCPSSFH